MKKLLEKNVVFILIIMMIVSLTQSVTINKKLTSLEQRNVELDNKLIEMENKLNTINSEIEKIEKNVEEKQNLIEEKQKNIDSLENKVNELEKSIKEVKTNKNTTVQTKTVNATNLTSVKNTYKLQNKKTKEVTFHISFYTSLACENGGYANMTASGKKLADGMVANNQLPFGTKIYVEGYGLKTVEDRGSSKYFTDETKIDIFVPRQKGESDTEYRKRVNAMGRKNIKGYIFI